MMIEILHAELPEGDPNVVPWKMYSSLAIDYNRRGWEIERIKERLAVAVAALKETYECLGDQGYAYEGIEQWDIMYRLKAAIAAVEEK